MPSEPVGSPAFRSAEAEPTRTVAPHLEVALAQNIHAEEAIKGESILQLEPHNLSKHEWQSGCLEGQCNPEQKPLDLTFAMGGAQRTLAEPG